MHFKARTKLKTAIHPVSRPFTIDGDGARTPGDIGEVRLERRRLCYYRSYPKATPSAPILRRLRIIVTVMIPYVGFAVTDFPRVSRDRRSAVRRAGRGGGETGISYAPFLVSVFLSIKRSPVVCWFASCL
ncbi:hypothetical protein EVAR_99966_1 [Eumeta japonica]|uniref:Uncharacterized protein n=1 Tax=Eumeta variegata TaxID=151549 RepID=A0A4C1SUR6_EUMVA|nr:hypothetical protein EVAR_99966_1 [Eumeta japonica]